MHTKTGKAALRIALALAVVATLTVGGTAAAAEGREDYGRAAIDYTLIAFDYETLDLTIYSRLGDLPPNPISPGDPYLPPNPVQPTLTVSFTQATTMLLAPLSPTDPCRALAESYNATAVSVDSSPYLAVSNLADQHCTARVRINLSTLTIRSFQPVP